VGREYKILLVKFFKLIRKNNAEIRVQTVLVVAQFAAEDRGSIDRQVDQPCTDVHKKFAVDRLVDHLEDAARAEDSG